MKWDQQAADLINPANEEKTEELETQLEITNPDLAAKPAGQRASVSEGRSGFDPNNTITFYITGPQEDGQSTLRQPP